MKYKCIIQYSIGDSVIMNPGDIIVIENGQLYNSTTNVDYRNIKNIEDIKTCLTDFKEGKELMKSNAVNRFMDITDKMINLFESKNHDYGNSFEQSLNEEGIVAARVRMGDKWNRFKTLSKDSMSKVKDESIKDTLIDLATYSIMTLMWLDK